MKKKVFVLSSIIFILITTIVVTFLSRGKVEAATATDENSITWNFTISNGYIENLTYYSGNISSDGKVYIPSKLLVSGTEYEVRSISTGSTNSSMFYNATEVNRAAIKEIIIPDTVKTIKDYAFYNVENLKTIDFGEGVTELGNVIVGKTSVTELYLPNSVTTLGYGCFKEYSSGSNHRITKISIGDGLNPIDVFTNMQYAPNVKEWTITENSENYSIRDGEIYSKDGKTLLGIKPNTVYTTYQLKDDVTGIGEYVFNKQCDNLTSVTLNDKLTTIGDHAFDNCSRLTAIVLPSTLKSIGNSAFRYCSGWTGELQLPDGLISIGNDAFINCNSLLGNLIIPDSVLTIGSGAFRLCNGFSGQLIIGNGLETIESNTFAGISRNGSNGETVNGFDKVTVGSGVKTIKTTAFTALKDFWINNLEGEVTFETNYGGIDAEPYPHYLNGTHRVTIRTSEGIKVINTTTNEEVLSGDYECETAFRYRVVIDPGYNYPDLKIIEINDDDYLNPITYDYLEGQEYDFTRLLRNRRIYVETIKDGNDLALRTFITEINYKTISKQRTPMVELYQEDFKYVHTKNPVGVEKDDDITFKVRVYNEGLSKLSADEVTVYIPEGMSIDLENAINKKNGWILADDGSAKTTILAGKKIQEYYGNGIVSYKDLDIVLKVTDESDQSENYKTVFAEITRESDEDTDSTPNNVQTSQNYMIEEILNSNANSAIASQEDDDDFDTIVLNAKIKVKYNIRINKVDTNTNEVLKGAKFNLTSYGTNELEVTDENTNRKTVTEFTDGEVIVTAISNENGIVDFGGITSYGEGENEYLVEEIDAPSGYLNNIGKKMKVRVVKHIVDKEKGTYTVQVFCDSADYVIDTSKYEFTPIKTAEQLAKIGSGETINIDGVDYEYNTDVNYKLMNDIDLSGINWTPIQNEINGVFDGNGYKISNLTIVSSDRLPYSEVGLLSTFSGIVENLTFENPNIHFTAYEYGLTSNTGYTGVGCFAGTMRQGGIYNCKTTKTEDTSASITSSEDNVGGLVGHTIPGGLVTIINCENNIDIIGLQTVRSNSNVGGLVGCALGSISVQDSVNNGNITVPNYNAGGLVGFVKSSEYQEMMLSAGYDEDNKQIDLLVENEAAEGEYNLTLEIRDRKTQELIGGAIYEIDQLEDDVKTKLIDTGSLKLFDKVIEYTGRDVYFLTEDETIEGYSKLNGIIKIVIERYWDNDADEYKVRAEATVVSQKEYEEFTGERATNDSDVKGEEFDRDTIFTDANIVNANWNERKAEFKNNTNNGKIQAIYMNAAGMVGTSYGVVSFENCTNAGEVMAKTKAAGIISELRTVNGGDNGPYDTQDTTANSRFVDCKNNGAIYTIGTASYGTYYYGNSGGIISEVRGYAVVTGATNNAEIISTGDRQIGGIVGQVMGGIEIKDSTNNGKVTAGGRASVSNVAGGIMGQMRCVSSKQEKTPYKNNYVRIYNCKNFADVIGYGPTSGILGQAYGNEVIIVNCEVKGTEENKLKINMLEDGACAGILALSGSKYTKVNGNRVEDCEIEVTNFAGNSTYDACGGIIADINSEARISGMAPKNEEDITIDAVIVNNNIVKNSAITVRNKECGGIIATSTLGYDSLCRTSINNCLVENTEIYNYNSRNSTYNTSGGIYGGGNTTGFMGINNCLVDNTRIIKTAPDGNIGSSQSTIGGIWGRGYNTQAITIENCDVKNSYMYDWAEEGTSGSPAGILGTIQTAKGNIIVRNCNLDNSTIIEYGQNVAGIVGGLANVSGDIIVENCDINETDIAREFSYRSNRYYFYNCIGYVLGYAELCGDIKLANINITGKDLEKGTEGRTTIRTTEGNLGGVVGSIKDNGKLTAKNITVKNIDIVNEVGTDLISSQVSCQIGGFGGTIQDESELTDITVDNCDIKGNKVHNAAGVIAALIYPASAEINNVNVKNTNITTELKLEDGRYTSTYGSAAGLISSQNPSVTYNNCNVENCKISSGAISASGMVAYAGSDTEVKNCTVKNIELIDNREDVQPTGNIDPLSSSYDKRIFAGVIAVAPRKYNIDNVVVDGVKCSAKYGHIGGILGTCNFSTGEAKINNCIVKNADLYSDGSVSAKGAVGGVVAEVYRIDEFKNNKVLDSKIKTTTHLLGGMIGYIESIATDISDCEVNNVELVHENKESYGPSMGGVIGTTQSEDLKIKNVTVKNSTLKAENSDNNITLHTGGIIGYTKKPSNRLTTENIILDNVNVINTEIENETPYSYTAGIAATGYAVVIKNSSVKEDCNITGAWHTAGFVGAGVVTIIDSKLLDSEVKSLGEGSVHAAGIIAIGNENLYMQSSLKGIEIKDTNITGKNAENARTNHVGGVATFYQGNMEDITMKNVNVSAGGLTGGVAAVRGSVGTTTDIELDNVNVTSYYDHAGGIAAVSDSKLSNVKVKNSTVQGNGMTGGIVGTINAEIESANVESTTIKSQTFHVGGVAACTQRDVKDSAVKGSTIITLKGTYGDSSPSPNCLGGLVGAGLDTSPDLSTSAVENNTLTGATGALVGKYIGAPTAINDNMVAAEASTTEP